MRKKIALLLAGVMAAAVIPVSAMAGTSVYANKVVTVKKNAYTSTTSELVIKDSNHDLDDDVWAEIKLELDGAEWGLENFQGSTEAMYDAIADLIVYNPVDDDPSTPEDESEETTGVPGVFGFNIVDSTTAAVFLIGGPEYIRIPLFTKVTTKGNATVTVDGRDTVVSSATCTYAVGVAGSARAKVAGTKNITEDGTDIKNITISETSAGALEAKKGPIKLKLSKGFKFDKNKIGEISNVIGVPYAPGESWAMIEDIERYDDRELRINVIGESVDRAVEFMLKGIVVVPDGAKVGAVAEITVSGAGIDKTTFEVGTYTDYGVKVAIFGDDEVPTFYSGRVYTKDDQVTLPVIISENVADSINANRKVTFTFPEGVKVTTATTGTEGDYNDGDGVYKLDDDSDSWSNVAEGTVEIKNNVVTFKKFGPDNKAKAAKMTFAFNLAISPEFTGDVDVVVGGTAIDVEETLTVAKVVPGYTVEATINEVAIDYRNVAVSDIVIKEAKPGVFEKDEILYLAVENMQFEKGMDFEVTAGDLEVKGVDVNVERGVIEIKFKGESAKEAGEITLSNVQLYLNRALPAGDYDLITLVDNDHWNVDAKGNITKGTKFSQATNLRRSGTTPYFEVSDVTLVKGYIKVVTAGRDVDDSTFTTKIVVPVGEKVIKAGDRDIAIDVPAFINADGYTMMPLRAVVQALSGTAIVTWDTETKTATVLFGARVISMTIGQKHMVINGVDVAMLAAPVIVESRTFLPLRDLGYALGLNESQVNWNGETKTATLN